MPAPAVLVHDLVKRYDGRAVVDGVSLTAERGAITAVLGPNGAGKTTTVECCEGLRSPDAGRVEVLGLHPLTDARALRPRVGVMLQDGGLPTGVRALEMLRHVASMYARPRDVGELTERLGLESFARTTVRRLSGGQRQRLALAAAIVGRPEVVFLDEPSAGMDPQSRHAVWELVRELRAEGVGIVLTTHLMDEAEDLADQVCVVDHGKVIAAGATRELLESGDDGETDRTVRVEATAGLDLGGLEVVVGGGRHAVIHPDVPRIANVTYLVRGDGATLLHPGDSFDAPDAGVLGGRRLDVLLAPVSAPWLKLAETIDFVRALDPRVVVPVHDALLSDVGHGLVNRLLGEQRTGGTYEYRPLATGESIDVAAGALDGAAGVVARELRDEHPEFGEVALLETDETVPPRPEEEAADVLRSDPAR